MSLTYGFYNSVEHDRVYDATQFGSIFDGVINDGVFQNIGDLFVVTPNNGMDIFVGSGRAWFNGTWTLNDVRYPLTVSESHPVYGRIDAVVLEVNQNSEVRANSFKIVEGTPGSTPARPTLINNEFVHQYPLAYITIPKNTTTITSSNIQNVVGTSACPFVTGILEVNDIDYLYSQWDASFHEWEVSTQADFSDWFEHIKGQLDEDAAGHLQNEIDAINVEINNINDSLSVVMNDTLTAGQTTKTFTNTKINSDSMLDLFVGKYGVTPTNATSTNGSVTYTFKAQSSNIPLKLRIINITQNS